MPPPKKDATSGAGKVDGRTQNGNRAGFRTDTAIANNRFGNERTLQPWVPDAKDALDGSLEKSNNTGHWDQFAENERLFGVKTDYDENIYTTAIDKSHPQYRERVAAAERKAREIESSVAATAHVAEERVMDYVAGNDQGHENEEDKYSGVRRQDFPALGARENKYTPPAKRAPTGQTSVKGAPVDPAIISSQIRAPQKKVSQTPEPVRSQAPSQGKNGVLSKIDGQKGAELKPVESKSAELKSAVLAADPKAAPEKAGTPVRPSAATSRTMSPQVQEGTPSATSTVERDVLKEFKTFATQQRINAEKVRSSKAKADKEVKLTELKKFADSFKLSTPVPNDLVSIIAKDPEKRREIQEKALKNAEDVAKSKAEAGKKEVVTVVTKETQPKAVKPEPVAAAPDSRGPRITAPTQPAPAPGAPNRHQGPRQPYPPSQYSNQQYRNNRNGPQHVAPQQPTGTLAQRLRSVEQQKFSQPPTGQDGRPPPTGPSSSSDSAFRRHSGVPGHLGAKLNPNSHEFKPSPFAATFSPNGQPSASSSPRSSVNNAVETPVSISSGGQLIRRKTKAIDTNKCNILLHVKSIKPPPGRNWDDNGGLRPPYDTFPTWRQIHDDEKAESTMQLTYKEYFERQPFSGPAALATPNPTHVAPQIAHQHQLPFHMQHNTSSMGVRQSPQIPTMRMDAPQHGHVPHPPFGNDDHRMMHSNSAQSFASPRPGQVPMAYGMNSPAQMPYNGPVYMGPGTPNMQYQRSFSNNPQFMQPQQGQLGSPMMMQPHFMPGPHGMVAAPQMMYPGQHQQFMPPSGPPQPMQGANGYHSPGRPTAPMMAHQGSQQGQPMYGMSPSVQYNQPAYNGPMPNVRGYNGVGPQHFGTSPQQGHQFVPQQRSGSNSYNRSYSSQSQNQGQHPVPPVAPAAAGASMNPVRSTDGSDEAK